MMLQVVPEEALRAGMAGAGLPPVVVDIVLKFRPASSAAVSMS